MPVMTVAMAFFIEGQQPTFSVVASLAVLSLGVAVCVWDNQVIPPFTLGDEAGSIKHSQYHVS
jgi:drug/metabolite transporter (DMT)-like permease